jgi:NADPH-dependent ferric siderophore reductase
LVHPDPTQPSTRQEDFIRAMDWPEGRVQTCIAGESSVVRSLRAFLHQEKALPRGDTYISGYWKIGLVEDEHQKIKRAEA